MLATTRCHKAGKVREPLAWEARLSPKEAASFKTLYGEAALTEKNHVQLFRLILNSRAAGTVTSYIASINRWIVFSRKNNFRQFPPEPLSFSLYITYLSETRASFSTFKMIKASFPFFYAARNCEDTCITKNKFVALALDGAMRKAAAERGPVKKASTFNETDIRALLQLIFWPGGSTNFPNPSLANWRTGVKTLYLLHDTSDQRQHQVCHRPPHHLISDKKI